VEEVVRENVGEKDQSELAQRLGEAQQRLASQDAVVGRLQVELEAKGADIVRLERALALREAELEALGAAQRQAAAQSSKSGSGAACAQAAAVAELALVVDATAQAAREVFGKFGHKLAVLEEKVRGVQRAFGAVAASETSKP
jgi:hypothetical protein